MSRDAKNVEWQVSGNDLFIKIDISKRFGLSSTGKTEIVATTSGGLKVSEGITLSLTAWAK